MKKFWNWVRIRNEAPAEPGTEPAPAESRRLYLNGTIAEESWWDDDITPAIFREELESEDGDIEVWINSPGGDVFAAAQIYNMLQDYKGHVTTFIDGMAASAASVIAMAGNTVRMSRVGMMMIHNPSTIAWGDVSEMQKTIDTLNAVKDSIMNAYQAKTGLTRAKISHLMDDETWMDANTALEMHFIDEIADPSGAMGTPNVANYSDTVLQNSIKERMVAAAKITPKPTGRKVADLKAKLPKN